MMTSERNHNDMDEDDDAVIDDNVIFVQILL